MRPTVRLASLSLSVLLTAACGGGLVTAGTVESTVASGVGAGTGAGDGNVPTGFVFGGYKDVTVNANWNTSEISTKVGGAQQAVVSANSNVQLVTWSFATGECGSETWGGITPNDLISANVAAWSKAGKQYIVATGGAAGTFSCGSDANFFAFLDRYNSSGFIGVDFDIEAGQSADTIAALVARVKAAQANDRYKNLRFSFTLATLGGSSTPALGATGVEVMTAIQKAGLSHYYINLMAMDYGSTAATNCVLNAAGTACDMGASAVQAAKALHAAYDVPYAQIEVTPMIGGNDAQDETFTLQDVITLGNFAKTQGLAGVHYWSLDRDTDCPPGSASPTCNTLGTAGAWGFLNAFLKAL